MVYSVFISHLLTSPQYVICGSQPCPLHPSRAILEELILCPALVFFTVSCTDQIGPEDHTSFSVVATEFKWRGFPERRAWLLVSGEGEDLSEWPLWGWRGVWWLWLGLSMTEKRRRIQKELLLLRPWLLEGKGWAITTLACRAKGRIFILKYGGEVSIFM